MATLANIVPTAGTDGVVYAASVPLTTSEAALGDAVATPSNIAVQEGQELLAFVKFSISGIVASLSGYVVLQADLGDGNWVDVAWAVVTEATLLQGSTTFVFSAGGRGAMNNVFRQTRQSGTVPGTSTGTNACPLGGRCRFVGKATTSGGSVGAGGGANQVAATITYKLTAPR